MYSKISFNKSVRRVIGYHEKKLEKGKAEYLLAENFIKDTHQLSREDKIGWMEDLTRRNEEVKYNTLHFSLNFSLRDRLTNEQMSHMAKRYMSLMGIGSQPYLVYRHYDSAHPHLHIVVSKIRSDGTNIHPGKKWFYESAGITRELEKQFSLTRRLSKAERIVNARELNKTPALRIEYGKDPVMPAIGHVLGNVVDHYKYTSLDEFNALLRLWNVKADRGTEKSKMYQHGGLRYSVLDKEGKAVGMPVKASAFDAKPTLKKLEEKFVLNKTLREEHRPYIEGSLAWIFRKDLGSIENIRKALKKEGVSVVIDNDRKDKPPSIYYVSHHEKYVFEGASLGERYTLQAILQRIAQEPPLQPELEQTQRLRRGMHR